MHVFYHGKRTANQTVETFEISKWESKHKRRKLLSDNIDLNQTKNISDI